MGCQIAWPLAATLASMGLLIGKPLALHALDLPESASGGFQVVRLFLGAAAYFGAAWLAMRLAGLALSGGSYGRRRSPRLLQVLFGAAVFGAAALATIALTFEESVLGAAATSGVIVAVLGFSLRSTSSPASRSASSGRIASATGSPSRGAWVGAWSRSTGARRASRHSIGSRPSCQMGGSRSSGSPTTAPRGRTTASRPA